MGPVLLPGLPGKKHCPALEELLLWVPQKGAYLDLLTGQSAVRLGQEDPHLLATLTLASSAPSLSPAQLTTEGLEAAKVKLWQHGSYSETQPLHTRTSLHPWVNIWG